MDIKNQPFPAKKFTCELCDYKCSKHSNWVEHTSTRKHKLLSKGYIKHKNGYINPADENDDLIQHSCECGKKYTHYSGLWRHKKKCINNNVIDETIDMHDKDALILHLLKQNGELQKSLIEMSKEKSVTNNNTHNNNSHNKTFN